MRTIRCGGHLEGVGWGLPGGGVCLGGYLQGGACLGGMSAQGVCLPRGASAQGVGVSAQVGGCVCPGVYTSPYEQNDRQV